MKDKQITTLPSTPPDAITTEKGAAAFAALAACQRVKIKGPDPIEAWVRAYPDVNIAEEIGEIEAWAVSANIHRSPVGWQRTINTWLKRNQDKTKKKMPRLGAAAATPGKYQGVGERHEL